MSDKDYIKELFSDKLRNYEAKVNPELWNSIASNISIGEATSSTVTGVSIVTKWIIGVTIVGAAAITALVISTSSTETPSESLTENKIAETKTEEVSDNVNTKQEIEAVGNEDNLPNPTPSQYNYQPVDDPQQSSGVNPLDTQDFSDTPLIPVEYAITIDEPIIQEMKQRDPVHTPDPVVHEPMMPEEIIAEEHHEQNNDFYVGKLPNVFTPNGDGKNDRFSIETENLHNFYIVVINDKNNVVYQSNDPAFTWDGRDQSGNYVPEGNYVYYITAKEFGTEKPKRFSPLLIKR